MFRTMLIGVDGREGGRDALALGRALAGPDTTIVLAHVWSVQEGLASAALGVPHPSRASTQLLEETRRAAGLQGPIVSRGAGSPYEGLHRLADRLEADLLIVGASHAAPDRLLSDQARGALHGAGCALAVPRRGLAAERRPVGRVGVAWDDGPEAREALGVGRAIARGTGAALEVLSVVSPVPSVFIPEAIATYEVLVEEVAGAEEERRRGLLADAGVDDPRIIRSATPAVAIAEWSADVDLLVLGSRGYGPVRRLFLGSTSDEVLAHGRSSVLVVPRGTHVEQDDAGAPNATAGAAA